MVSTVVTGGCVSNIAGLLIPCAVCGCKPELHSSIVSINRGADAFFFYCPNDQGHAHVKGSTAAHAAVEWYNHNRKDRTIEAVVEDAANCIVRFVSLFPKEEEMAAPRGFSGYESRDNWKHRSSNMRCSTCMWYAPKVLPAGSDHDATVGRCRRHAPSMNGFPVVYVDDWCGDHKLDEEKI